MTTPADPPSAAELAEHRRTMGYSEAEPIDVVELRGRYRRLARENHTDMGGSDAAMAAINVAYGVLSEHPAPPRRGVDPDVLRIDIPMSEPVTAKHGSRTGRAVDALRGMDDLLDTLRSHARPVSSVTLALVEVQDDGSFVVSGVPAGGSVRLGFAHPGDVQVFDAEGREVEALWL